MLEKFFAKLEWWLKLSLGAIFTMDIGIFLPWYYNQDSYYYTYSTTNYNQLRIGFDTGLVFLITIISVVAIAGCLAEKTIAKSSLVKIIAQIIPIIGGLWQLLYVYLTVLDFDDYYGTHELLVGF